MYRQENALDAVWWYAFLKTFALSWLVASMLSLALGFPACQRLHDRRNHLLLLFFILPGMGKLDLEGCVQVFFFLYSFSYFFSMKGLCQWSCGLSVRFQCVVAGQRRS